MLLENEAIADARKTSLDADATTESGFTVSEAPQEEVTEAYQRMSGAVSEAGAAGEEVKVEEEDAEELELLEQKRARVHSFEIFPRKVEQVKKAAIEIDFPMLEEYDFRRDDLNPSLPVDLRPRTSIRSYQEKSLNKMFGNGRARSGIIVLPCGAGKTLVGITACSTIKKSCLILCTSAVAVEQWKEQFKLWTTLHPRFVRRFTSKHKEMPENEAEACVIITTYSMIAHTGRRTEETKRIMDLLSRKEWGLLLMDEVHVVPAKMFRTVITRTSSHCKLGLTATLVREDELISDLSFLIGPKLYEANWMDLTQMGHIARVQCAEVWCPMTAEFYNIYLEDTSRRRMLLYAMNPSKFHACWYLIRTHEQRGDKIIVFSDNVFALRCYAEVLKKPFIYGKTAQQERERLLKEFQHNPAVNVIFMSKVGDNSINLPEASVIIQISSHFGSRRQEAQRLGRILRPKSVMGKGFNAFFYTLVSTDTKEMVYSEKRQQFLVDQGYAFKVITKLCDEPGYGCPHFRTKEQQKQLLLDIMRADEGEGADEELAADPDDISGMRRSRNKLSRLSGADGLLYRERRSHPKPAAKAKPMPKLFKEHARALRRR
eukprot:PLAT7035.7.p1 GENE.PLAT7035.7~~PLAT7035.7.p1  ORF type:complete len:601 (+),score=254.89 PLAT7035.7:613-2415(+)